MSRHTCDRAPLVEAMFDGRLGSTERASTERHLQGCASCAELLGDLTSIQASLRSSPRAVSPLEHQRARLALLRRTAVPSATMRRPAAPLVAVLVFLPLGAWAAVSSFAPLRAWMTAPAPMANVSLPSSTSERESPREPLPTTPPQETLPMTAQGDADQAAIERPRAGRITTSPPRASSAVLLPSTSSRPPRPSLSAPAPSLSRRARNESAKKPAGVASSGEAPSASQEFAEAMQALARGDFSAGASRLGGFAAAHPHDSRVEDAIYLEAIALERAGQIDAAKAVAKRYLVVYPDGAHAAQARRLAGN